MNKKSFLLVLTAFVGAVFFSFGCSGDSKPATLEQTLLNYDKGEYITFSVAGDAKCPTCLTNEIPVIGMQIEVMPKNDPERVLVLKMFDGLGPFTIYDLKAGEGVPFVILGTLYREGPSGAATMRGYAEFEAPDENDEVVSIILTFPSSEDD